MRELAVGIDVTGYLRIIEARHRATPTGMGHGETRFASPAGSFTLLYAAQDLPTALAEKVVRDRFQGRRKRILLQADIEEQVVASLVAREPLKLLDLRTSGASRLGVPTDAVRGRSQQAGRKFSQQLYDATDFDGIVYMSRITNSECVALYDRAVNAKLDPTCKVHAVSELADLISALASLSIELRTD
ncbi:RES family NAD+ phosphorylase [Sphingopyxis sp. PET50]|uniref:RES family NAD+ phosphorylase n=1 Tax=Sphingopyxis sp. PET50 TaxID=2976533 RepID=UPI0021AEE9CD|nr:RES family NAD+ phosphorylase [Sphingopyxis sp. PET50]